MCSHRFTLWLFGLFFLTVAHGTQVDIESQQRRDLNDFFWIKADLSDGCESSTILQKVPTWTQAIKTLYSVMQTVADEDIKNRIIHLFDSLRPLSDQNKKILESIVNTLLLFPSGCSEIASTDSFTDKQNFRRQARAFIYSQLSSDEFSQNGLGFPCEIPHTLRKAKLLFESNVPSLPDEVVQDVIEGVRTEFLRPREATSASIAPKDIDKIYDFVKIQPNTEEFLTSDEETKAAVIRCQIEVTVVGVRNGGSKSRLTEFQRNFVRNSVVYKFPLRPGCDYANNLMSRRVMATAIIRDRRSTMIMYQDFELVVGEIAELFSSMPILTRENKKLIQYTVTRVLYNPSRCQTLLPTATPRDLQNRRTEYHEILKAHMPEDEYHRKQIVLSCHFYAPLREFVSRHRLASQLLSQDIQVELSGAIRENYRTGSGRINQPDDIDNLFDIVSKLPHTASFLTRRTEARTDQLKCEIDLRFDELRGVAAASEMPGSRNAGQVLAPTTIETPESQNAGQVNAPAAS